MKHRLFMWIYHYLHFKDNSAVIITTIIHNIYWLVDMRSNANTKLRTLPQATRPHTKHQLGKGV